ncbi:MAG: MupG family TIM beta-alpha barrel fold protein, partial [Bifidobacteriaceae bacterium]|nr:MupG family TIM beta-alpha barrel fold protein [Bifidobacteriaceae bacterium]
MLFSLYPTDAPATRAAVAQAAARGPDKLVFTSLHIPESSGLREFGDYLASLHRQHGLVFCADISPHTLEALGIGLDDLASLKDWGVVTARIDFGFEPAAIRRIAEHFTIAVNASTADAALLDALEPLSRAVGATERDGTAGPDSVTGPGSVTGADGIGRLDGNGRPGGSVTGADSVTGPGSVTGADGIGRLDGNGRPGGSVTGADGIVNGRGGVVGWHNYYPRPETGITAEFFRAQSRLFEERGWPVYSFIPGETTFRAPLHLGLPMLESQRYRNSYVNYAEVKALSPATKVVCAEGALLPRHLDWIAALERDGILTLPLTSVDAEAEFLFEHPWRVRGEVAAVSWRLEGTRSGRQPRHLINADARWKGSIQMDLPSW